jgi:hypothetical protein
MPRESAGFDDSTTDRHRARVSFDDEEYEGARTRPESDSSSSFNSSSFSESGAMRKAPSNARAIELNQPAQVRSGATSKTKGSKDQSQTVSIPIKINSTSNAPSPYSISPQVRSSLKMESLCDSRLSRQLSASPDASSADVRHGSYHHHHLSSSPRRSNMSAASNSDSQPEQKPVVASGFPYEEKILLGVTDLREERSPTPNSPMLPPTQPPQQPSTDLEGQSNQPKLGFWHPTKRPFKYATCLYVSFVVFMFVEFCFLMFGTLFPFFFFFFLGGGKRRCVQFSLKNSCANVKMHTMCVCTHLHFLGVRILV